MIRSMTGFGRAEITTEEYKTKAIRPKNSRLSKKSLIEANFSLLPTWKDALKRYIKELKELKGAYHG